MPNRSFNGRPTCAILLALLATLPAAIGWETVHRWFWDREKVILKGSREGIFAGSGELSKKKKEEEESCRCESSFNGSLLSSERILVAAAYEHTHIHAERNDHVNNAPTRPA